MIIMKKDKQEKIDSEIQIVELVGSSYKGRNEYLKFLRGERVTRKEAILAECYACQGFYVDGKYDCKSVLCPLYAFYPYRADRVKKKDSDNIIQDE